MALTSAKCQEACQEDAEFKMKFVITSLKFLGKGKKAQDMTDVFIIVAFDGNVFKFHDLKQDDKGKLVFVGHELIMQLSPEGFSRKLRSCPIMFDLCRDCAELGTFVLEVPECFYEAVKCDEFAMETITTVQTFKKDEAEVAEVGMIFQVLRETEDAAAQKLRKAMKKKLDDKKKANDDTNDSSSSSLDSLDPDLCPNDESLTQPCSLGNSKSNPNSSKCCSDIAAPLDARDFADDQKSFCNGCGGFSISGVTCTNKKVIFGSEASGPSSHCSSVAKTPRKCQSQQSTVVEPKPRICSECFENLTVVPNDAPCPNCSQRAQLPRKPVSFQCESQKAEQNEMIRDNIKSIFEEIFLETKDKLINDWNRLKCPKKKKKPKKKQNNSGVPRPSFARLPRKKMLQNIFHSQIVFSRCPKVSVLPRKRRTTKPRGLLSKHPGVLLGHNFCRCEGALVPKKMGWLWNVEVTGLSASKRCGWRPGAVRKSVAKIMAFHAFKPPQRELECKSNPPTLRVHKKDGEYTIVMNPLREKSNVDPSPIVFKITKSDDAKARAKARGILKARGVEMKCECGTVEECKCLNECQKAFFELEMARISNQLRIKPKLTARDLRLSSDSEIDIEFTPPNAALALTKPAKVSYAETQYENMLENTKNCDDGSKEDKSGGDTRGDKTKGDKVKGIKSASKGDKTKKKKNAKKGAKAEEKLKTTNKR